MGSEQKAILLVDDSALMLEVAQEALEAIGYKVVVAGNLSELEAKNAGFVPDLVLMDVQMPELFGDDIAAVLRNVRGMEAPIYLWSNLEHEQLAERSKKAGIDGYVCKRDGIEVLIEKVKSILGD